ncbi:hypothetical protein QYM36_002039 [Artemia franciscana]|uniref:Reverse transcriptase RNase H-like domain-containing protein n=1 Tax=Artemia franciscana TaxID=6661 RepID=A0AA88I823_ARTSF|nr:hypothetical protein QYM36_002039 [Artemia franciscana]
MLPGMDLEQNLVLIEKDLYAILYGCRKFHQLVYGRRIAVHTDHKKLEAILSKLLCQAPPRLQRMMLELQPYDIMVQCTRGKYLPVADMLSSLHPPHFNKKYSMDIEFHIQSIVRSIPVSDKNEENRRYPVMIELGLIIQKEWPNH